MPHPAFSSQKVSTMSSFERINARAADALRPIRITRHYTVHAEGAAFSRQEMDALLGLAESGIRELVVLQQHSLLN